MYSRNVFRVTSHQQVSPLRRIPKKKQGIFNNNEIISIMNPYQITFYVLFIIKNKIHAKHSPYTIHIVHIMYT